MRRPWLVALVVGAGAPARGCDGGSWGVKETAGDASASYRDSGVPSAVDGSPDGEKDCFDDPKTHFEIINACTTATRVPKNPTLRMLLADGGLPPLE